MVARGQHSVLRPSTQSHHDDDFCLETCHHGCQRLREGGTTTEFKGTHARQQTLKAVVQASATVLVLAVAKREPGVGNENDRLRSFLRPNRAETSTASRFVHAADVTSLDAANPGSSHCRSTIDAASDIGLIRKNTEELDHQCMPAASSVGRSWLKLTEVGARGGSSSGVFVEELADHPLC